MSDRVIRKQLFGAILGLSILSLAVFFVVDRPEPSQRSVATPEAPRTNAPPNAEPRTNPSASVEQSARKSPLPATPVAQDSLRAAPTDEPVGPACKRDEDCTGPMSADCVSANCDTGHCRYDKSACECIQNDDCDDGDPCTRDHCFAKTLACIHIEEDCGKD